VAPPRSLTRAAASSPCLPRRPPQEIDRARAQARSAKYAPGEKREGTPQSRNEKDAAALKAKLEAKAARLAAEAEGGGGGGGGGGGK